MNSKMSSGLDKAVKALPKELKQVTANTQAEFDRLARISLATFNALIANGKSIDGIAQWMDVKKVTYLDEEDLRQAIGINKLCMACINNKYPTETAEGVVFMRERKKVRVAG